MKIALLCPSRDRAEQLCMRSQTWVRTAARKNNLSIRVYVDIDEQYRYAILPTDYTILVSRPISLSPGPDGIGSAWNRLARIEEADIYGMINDDIEMWTEGWDEILIKHVTQQANSDGIDPRECLGCWHWNDGINGKEHAAFPFVTHKWVEVHGGFAPELFHFFYHDTWIFDVFQRIRRTFWIEDIRCEHFHFAKTKMLRDATSEKHSHCQPLDREIWNSTAVLRHEISTSVANEMAK